MRSFAILLAIGLLFPLITIGQKKKSNTSIAINATSASEQQQGFLQHRDLQKNNPFEAIKAENLGPTVMSGRVVDLAVNPQNPHHFYVAYATGGLWETINNGASFTPIFDQQEVIGIGAIAVDWKNQKIWIGTGESNSSRSSYSGFGIYSGSKKGSNYEWRNMGLHDTHHIARILIHPSDPQIIYIAALGHLYSPNPERGIFMTQDGGTSWQQVLHIDDQSGCADLEIDPNNPQILYASTWPRSRQAWNFEECGSGSMIYQSLDKGLSWQVMPTLGLPIQKNRGRIGLACAVNDQQKFLYAFIDDQTFLPSNKQSHPFLTKDDFKDMHKEKFLLLPDDSLDQFLKSNNLSAKHNATSLKQAVRQDIYTPKAIYDFLYEPTAAFYENEIAGAGLYRFDFDASKWQCTHDEPLSDLVYSYGYYFAMVEVNTQNPNEIFIAGVPLIHSSDGGKNWKGINPVNVHPDHHALWINPQTDGHLISGCDGGIQMSYDKGKTWTNCNSPSLAQCYAVAVDQSDTYQVYCGLQDNGVWRGPSNYRYSTEWYQTGHYPYRQIMGGDGMQIAIDPRNPDRIYTGYQFGQYAQVDPQGNTNFSIHPTHELGETPLRWNWQTPIMLSPHQPDLFYICSNKVHRSKDGGRTFETLSPDLTRNILNGDVPFGTITCISESPQRMGHLVVGSDDGWIHLSHDNGYTWTNITGGLTTLTNAHGSGLWVSRLIFSKHHHNRIYVSFNGYRDDHFRPYIYYTENDGQTWIPLHQSLPINATVNVIKEDSALDDLLYVGTDHALYALDMEMNKPYVLSSQMPGAAIHDMVIHEKSQQLILGTHGRGIYRMDLRIVQHFFKNKNSFSIAPIPSIAHGNRGDYWSKWFDNDYKNLEIPVFSPTYLKTINMNICTADSMVLCTHVPGSLQAGLQYVTYDLTYTDKEFATWQSSHQGKDLSQWPQKPAKDGKKYLPPGTYFIRMEKENEVVFASFTVTE
jgi:hypothetical protein